MENKTGRTKRIFVSDIHMGDEESINPPGGMSSWGWLGTKRAQMFADFLEKTCADPQVMQVIILGDLFDEWVCPSTISPVPTKTELLNQFQKIANASQNRAAINGLKKIASSEEIDLIYVPGNHDMLITKEILEEIIPGINYQGVSEGVGVFCEDGISAEHGSLYCLFNAPDSYDNPGHILPLGYFITRAVAYKSAKSGTKVDLFQVIKNAVEHIAGRDSFAKLVFESVVAYAGLTKDSPITMNGIDSYTETIAVNQVENIFENLYTEWEKEMKNNVNKEQAVTDDMGFLYPAAISQYFMKKKSSIVIFGHTHDYKIRGILSGNIKEDMAESIIGKLPCSHIYANSGTWIDQKSKCTFVETEIDTSQKKHYVRVKQYKDGGEIAVLGERHKDLGHENFEEDMKNVASELHRVIGKIL